MKLIKIRICIFILLFAQIVSCSSNSNKNDKSSKIKQVDIVDINKTYKVLHIMSFHQPYEWCDSIQKGFEDGSKDLKLECKIFQMDFKRVVNEQQRNKKVDQVKNLISSFKPDLILASDDDTSKYLGEYFKKLSCPVVYTGLNNDPSFYGYNKCNNITGVLEQENYNQTVELAREIIPNFNKFIVIADESDVWNKVIDRIKDNREIQSIIKLSKFSELKEKIEILEKSKDVNAILMLGLFEFKDENNNVVDYKEIQKWINENCKIPDFSFWKDRVTYGTLFAVAPSGYNQGFEAAKLSKEILINKKKPSEIKSIKIVEGEKLINYKRAKDLGISIKRKSNWIGFDKYN